MSKDPLRAALRWAFGQVNPAQLRTQTRESRTYQEETREIAQGERIRFTSYDKETGVRSGDLGTVTRVGQDLGLLATGGI